MIIMGCDLHTRYQEISRLDTTTGEVVTRRLEHENGEARAFLAQLTERAQVGIEQVARTADFAVRGSSLASVFTVSYCSAVSRLRRPFLSHRYFFITVRV